MDHVHDNHDDMDMGHDSMGGSKSCPMIMSFHAGHCERILWNGWVASTVTEFVFSALAIFLISFLYEALKFVREYYLRKSAKQESARVTAELRRKNGLPTCHGASLAEIRQKSYLDNIFEKGHIMQTIVNLIQIILSYLLMLVFMTFNYWLCLAVVLGMGVGYFFFGWIKRDAYDNECCP